MSKQAGSAIIAFRALAIMGGFMLAFAMPQTVRADNVDEQIKALVMQFHNASTTGDIDFMEYITSKSSNALAVGSDPAEIITGHDAIVAWWQGLFDYLEALGYPNGGLPVISPIHLQVGHKDGVAWAADQAVWHLANGDMPFRVTLVFRKEHGEWKIIQQHFSNGVPNSQLPF
jgi:ketosteroid isomerase-like protein